MRLLPLLVMLTTSCATGLTSVQRQPRRTHMPCLINKISPHIDQSLQPYVDRFSADAISREVSCYGVQNISLGKKVKPGVAGYCIPQFTVVLSDSYWNTASEQERLTLVYHELGHCALDKDHTKEDELEIMNPYILPDSIAEGNWDQLVDNLFRGTEDER